MQTMRMDKAQYKIARFDGVARVARAAACVTIPPRYRSVSAFHRKPHLLGDDKSMQANP